MPRGYDAFNPDGRADYFCHPWNYEIKVGDKGLSLDAVWAESPHTLNQVDQRSLFRGLILIM